MRTIWKFEVVPEDGVQMPEGAEILTLQTQNGTPFLWALVDPAAPVVSRRFAVYGTGHDMPDSPGRYWGTFQVRDIIGSVLVFHVFEPPAEEEGDP